MSDQHMKKVKRFLQMIDDFGTLSGGKFREKYPDQDAYEGYGYLMRYARKLEAALATQPAAGSEG